MSWSAYYIGTPDNIAKALQKQSDSLSGNIKTEFDAAMPHIIALLGMNYGNGEKRVMHLQANGSAYDGTSSCVVRIDPLMGALINEETSGPVKADDAGGSNPPGTGQPGKP